MAITACHDPKTWQRYLRRWIGWPQDPLIKS
jgi:hypothetical protein